MVVKLKNLKRELINTVGIPSLFRIRFRIGSADIRITKKGSESLKLA